MIKPKLSEEDIREICPGWNIDDVFRVAKENGIKITKNQAVSVLFFAETYHGGPDVDPIFFEYYLERLDKYGHLFNNCLFEEDEETEEQSLRDQVADEVADAKPFRDSFDPNYDAPDVDDEETNTLTDSQKEDYLESGRHCPFCTAESLTVSALAKQLDGSIYEEVVCNFCRKEWVNFYTLGDIFVHYEDGK